MNERLERLSFTTSEVAQMLGISQWKVKQLIARGELPARNTCGAQRPRYVVSKRALEDWLGLKVQATA